MKRLGIDLGTLTDQPVPLTDAPDCPGAALRVSRDMVAELERGGERFLPAKEPVPFNAMGNARVRCSNRVAQLPKTASGAVQFYGLCHSCSALEADNRAALRERARPK
jgi:hypothetical protein